MRLTKKERKKFYSRISFILDPGKKIPKKIAKKLKKLKKTSFRHYFLPKWDEMGRKREKNILGQNSAHITPRQENNEKNSKKIQKIKEPLSSNI